MGRAPLALALLLPLSASAQVELGGHAETSHFFGLRDGAQLDYGTTNVLGLVVAGDVNDHVALFGALELRHTAFSVPGTTSELGRRSRVEPLVPRLAEAYVDLYGLGFEGLDVRVGKQVIAWGTADGLNPTSYLAPFDLENPLDFRERLGVAAIVATFYAPYEIRVTGAVAPLFTPSLLPVDLFAGAVEVPFELPEGVVLGDQRDVVALPAANVREVQLAARIAGRVFDVDVSASWFRGYQTLPVLSEVDVYDIDLTSTPIAAHVEATVRYPRTQAVGFDLATSLLGMGLWAEGAVFFPEEIAAPVLVLGEPEDPLTGEPLDPIAIVEKTPYLKLVLGVDYTFEGGWYVNLQYLHGFFHELTAADIDDYALLAGRKTFFDGELEVQLSLGGELVDEDTLGWLVGGEVAWKPFDATRLVVGALAARGDPGSTFRGFEGLDQIYLRVRADF